MTGRVALGLVLLGAGTLWLLDELDVLDLGLRMWVGIVLIGIGLAIILTPGRRRALALLGILVALIGAPALLVDDDVFDGGVGERTERPQSSADLERFRHGIGKLTVDLTEPGLPLDGVTVEASLGMGDLLVLVPLGTDVSYDAHVSFGNAEILGDSENGVDVDLSGVSDTAGRQELSLDLDVGMGNLRVELD